MQRRILYTLFSAIVIAMTIVLQSHSIEAAASPEISVQPADSSISAAFNLVVGDRVTFELTVTNNTSKRVEIRFPSGKTHDFVVMDSVGREVWRWSSGRLFTQVVQNRLIEPRESVKFAESWKNPDTTGTFVAVAQLESRNFPLESRTELVIPAQRPLASARIRR